MSREVICTNCNHIGYPKKLTSFRNNFLVSTLLWVTMLPGLLYFIWNLTLGNKKTCSECGSTDVVSLDSRYGQILMEEIYMKKMNAESSPDKKYKL